MKTQVTLVLLLVLVASLGCDEEQTNGRSAEREAYQAQLRTEQDAKRQVEERLAQERRRRDRDKEVAKLELQQENRKSTLAVTLAVAAGSLAVVVIILLARERRIRQITAAAMRWLWERART